jgi:hypothetical protein
MEIEGQHVLMPMVAADKSRLTSLPDKVLAVLKERDVPIKLVKFSALEILEQYTGAADYEKRNFKTKE